MVRPGPQTKLKDVKTAILELLEDNPEGMNFNAIFRKLKDKKVLGSFSVLNRAMKDLRESNVVSYREVEKQRYKIPMKIYTLTPKTLSTLKMLLFSGDQFRDIGSLMEEEKRLEKISSELLKELNLEKGADAALLFHLLLITQNLAYVHKLIVEKDENWRLIFNYVLNYQRNFMELVAENVASEKVQKDEDQEMTNNIIKALSRLNLMLLSRLVKLAEDESAKAIQESLSLSGLK